MDKALALDTALNNCSAAVYTGGKIYAESIPMVQGHGEQLVPMVMRVMGKAGMAFDGLEAVVTTIGPGAFTGMRIGLSAAKHFALVLGVPLFGISTMQILASQYAATNPSCDAIAVILETKRQDFYFQPFSAGGHALKDAAALPAAEIAKNFESGRWAVIGDAHDRFRRGLSGSYSNVAFEEGFAVPDMGLAARMLAEDKGEAVFSEGAEPLYLRGADVSVSTKEKRVLETRDT